MIPKTAEAPMLTIVGVGAQGAGSMSATPFECSEIPSDKFKSECSCSICKALTEAQTASCESANGGSSARALRKVTGLAKMRPPMPAINMISIQCAFHISSYQSKVNLIY